eukprot:m.218525 g.218525  ORF g.218525 m.218525 type:complete len:87 (-) comp17220_c0_seq20:3450-3710(-)
MLHLSEEAPTREEATEFAQKGLDLARKAKDLNDDNFEVYQCLGSLSIRINNPVQGAGYFRKALTICANFRAYQGTTTAPALHCFVV